MRKAARVLRPVTLALTVLTVLIGTSVSAQNSFLGFESGHVRPMAMNAAGNELYVVNTPDNALEVFTVGTGGIVHSASVAVGLEPVSVALNALGEVWVVNHVSDSVSMVDAASRSVTRTLLVGDEPRDIVFAGATGNRAFITTAHRGQHRTDSSIAAVPGAGDPELSTAGVGRSDVWVFDADNLGTSLGGTPVEIVQLFGDTPRGLAASPDGTTVYAAVFHSGNQTTTVAEDLTCRDFDPNSCVRFGETVPGGNPGPSTNHAGENAPEVSLIVKYDQAAGEWRDELDRDWSNVVRFNLPDKDVFAIDADSLLETDVFTSVGTILFNLVVNPQSGKVYVSNTEARNEVRFECAGDFGGTTVQGRLSEARITVLDGSNVDVRHLNKHIDYSKLVIDPDFDLTAKDHSLATPVEMVVSSDGATLYVAAFGSSRVGVFDTTELESDTFDPTLASAGYLSVSGGGPSGLVLDEGRNRLYVTTRFDNSVSVIDLQSGSETHHIALHNPEPVQVVEGRPFLYDADFTSANGEASCASCHIFGDLDSLAWNLGDPDGDVTKNPLPINLGISAGGDINGTGNADDFHPMKGPMTTQTMRGMVNHGALHWRGDRAPSPDPFDANASFLNFNPAFQGLVGRSDQLTPTEMQAFADFAMRIVQPPNPVRPLNNRLSETAEIGNSFYNGDRRADGIIIVPGLGFTCNGCHTLNPAAGFFGTSGEASFEDLEQIVKIPHLRNLYQKVGMFGMAEIGFLNAGDNAHQGDQVRGFGFLHDGSVDTAFRFFQARVFNPNAGVGFDGGDDQRRGMEQFMLEFPSDLAPIVGQQITYDATSDASVVARLDLLLGRSNAAFNSKLLGPDVTECDLVAKGVISGSARGWTGTGGTAFLADDGTTIEYADLQQLALDEGPITFTCVPPGSGVRIGVNRDGDALTDGVDNCPARSNNSQADLDLDGVGDACDNCLFLSNPSQIDLNANGRGDVCEPRVGTSLGG